MYPKHWATSRNRWNTEVHRCASSTSSYYSRHQTSDLNNVWAWSGDFPAVKNFFKHAYLFCNCLCIVFADRSVETYVVLYWCLWDKNSRLSISCVPITYSLFCMLSFILLLLLCAFLKHALPPLSSHVQLFICFSSAQMWSTSVWHYFKECSSAVSICLLSADSMHSWTSDTASSNIHMHEAATANN